MLLLERQNAVYIQALMNTLDPGLLSTTLPAAASAPLQSPCVTPSLACVTPQSTLLLSYFLETADEVLEGCDEEHPLKLTLGQGTLSPLVEARLLGRVAGEEFSTTMEAALLFGAYNAGLKFQISLKKLPAKVATLELGDGFESYGPDRKRHFFRMLEKSETNAVFDGNLYQPGDTITLRAKILDLLDG